jgi:hypothetical protein
MIIIPPIMIRRHFIVSQDAQRRRIAQLDHRRQGKAQQQHHRAPARKDDRAQARVREVAREQVGQYTCEQLLGNVAHHAAGQHAEQAEQQQLHECNLDDEALCSTEALHQRDRVHAPMRKTTRRHRDRDRTQQQADHGGQ